MHKDELSAGALRYRLGHSYKECKTTQELNEWTIEERLSKCGFLDKHWNQSGNSAGRQLRINVPENNVFIDVFHAERVPKQENSIGR